MSLPNPTGSALSSSSSFFLSAIIAASYLGGIYLSRAGRITFAKPLSSNDGGAPIPIRSRDDAGVIRARLKGVCISSLFSCGVIYTLVALDSRNRSPWITAIKSTAEILGLNVSRKGLISCLLVPLLYTGPLTAMGLSKTLPFQSRWSFKTNARTIFGNWIGLRNFIVAPLTEEIVFRACLLSVGQLSGRSLYSSIFITPLWFGLAHLHHAYELYHNLGATNQALKQSIITVLFQLTYTTLFGAYASFLYLRTGSIIPPISAHIFANIMGLPQPALEARIHPKRRLLIWSAYLVGLSGFIWKSGPWTA